ncbi:sulfatase [uncultured Dysosmobacter sp.]|uniref:sulfatase family protein n=1 Tax=uncultured Dysosmobacter sp. TaxID=2591384 RepID=UPI00261D8E9C|nr:sulfatase-like hydrolase/transferase [uncultured Dysosmobacter sp.]
MSKRKNILFILTDDHGAWAMGCAGNHELKTPNLDRIAAHGVRFDNFFCASPVCSPARMSIYTGKIPSQHGVHDWLAKGHLDERVLSDELKKAFASDTITWEYRWPKSQLHGDKPIRYLDRHVAFTQLLAENGYECGLSGKWHMGDSYTPQAGFSYWKTTAMGGENYFYPVVLENGVMELKHGQYITNIIADNAIAFLDLRQRPEDPFFLAVHFTAPHSPWSEVSHPKEYIDLYRDCPFDSTPNVPPHPWAPNGKKTLAQWNSESHEGIRFSSAKYGPIPETWQEHRRESLTGYYAAVTAMDAQVGRLLDELEARGLAEDTMIVFTGDNGMNMGHHGIWGKGNGTLPVNMYDTSVKVPGLFACPGVIPENWVCHEMASHYDLYETILDMADVPFQKPAEMPGVSFARLLTGKAQRVRDSVVVFDEYGPCRMIRTMEWKLVLRYPDGPNELYDLAGDPGEEKNLYGRSQYAEVQAALAAQLGDWFQQYVDPRFDGRKEAVCGRGQLTSHSFQ